MTAAALLPAASGSETDELRERVRELEEALHAIRAGQVDAFVISGAVATSRHASAAADRLRQETLEQMRDAVLAFDHAGHVVYMNPAAELQYGWASVEALGRPSWELYEEITDVSGADGSTPSSPTCVHVLRDGRSIHVEATVSPLLDGAGKVFGTVAVVRDITDRKGAEDRRNALARLGEHLRHAQDPRDAGVAAELALTAGLAAAHAACLWSDSHTLESAMAQALRPEAPGLIRCAPIQVTDTVTAVLAAWSPDDSHIWTAAEIEFAREVADRTRSTFERIAAAAALRESEARLRHANENLETAIALRTNELMIVEEALRQAQKMEAVGQLTGGLAHDFNNLLASISGSLQVLRMKLARGQSEGCERYIDMGLESVKRAAALTQRLLAFARRQTLDSRPTDVNRLVAGMEDLIQRTVGAAVAIEVAGSEDLWTTNIDPPQLESALLNLCLNARDGMMPGGGQVTISTANVRIDSCTDTEQGLAPGDYVVLSVADTGSGMSPETIARIFDPFFTTKPLGQGTGLGLSMVYGFVRQSGGQVRVVSDVGRGTTMSLYLPRHQGAPEAAEDEAVATALAGGQGETVLLIEDQDSIRIVIAEVLTSAGYRVRTAGDGPSGLQLLQEQGRVDLLITDVGLPGGLNGRQVADAGRISRPGLKVLFITGYAENAAVGDGQLESGMEVLTKPFDLESLTRRVRQMIG
ncbi:MAG: ATP-binding protein [Pseudomonadota bacterium]